VGVLKKGLVFHIDDGSAPANITTSKGFDRPKRVEFTRHYSRTAGRKDGRTGVPDAASLMKRIKVVGMVYGPVGLVCLIIRAATGDSTAGNGRKAKTRSSAKQKQTTRTKNRARLEGPQETGARTARISMDGSACP
jgi:hypothetical protein